MKSWEILPAMNLVSQSITAIDYIMLTSYFFSLLEEHETEGGEHVVGLMVKEKEEEGNGDEDAPGNRPRKCFSIDFPPGLVHLDSESQSTPSQTWTLIKHLLANRKSSKL